MTKDTSREAADRGQGALAEALVPFTRAVLHDDIDKWRLETATAILGEHGVYLPDGRGIEDFRELVRFEAREFMRLKAIAAAARAPKVDGCECDPCRRRCDCARCAALRAALATDGAETP